MMCIYKHCFPPILLVLAMKCCTKMPCPLPHNHYFCLLFSPICLPHLLICTCLISSPIACPPSSVLCWCLLRFFYFWYMLHFFVTPFWIVCVHIFVWLFFFIPFHFGCVFNMCVCLSFCVYLGVFLFIMRKWPLNVFSSMRTLQKEINIYFPRLQKQKPFEHLNRLAVDHIDQITRNTYTTASGLKQPKINKHHFS